ncbi:hypothetical protein HZB08_01315, partial [Candidatus Saganbacteria bacterium]|nr:hypothetical protein [Candidatus Saganbacteria bacterium]
MDMVYYFDLLGLCVVVILGLAVYIYLQNRSGPINLTFSTMLLLIVLAGGFDLLWQISAMRNLALFFYRLQYLPELLSLVFALYFLLVFPENRDVPSAAKAAIFSPAVLLGVLTVFTGLIVKDFKLPPPGHLYPGQPVFGSLYFIPFIHQAVFYAGCAACLIYKLRRGGGWERIRLSLVMFAAVLAGLLGSVLLIALFPALSVHGLHSFGKMVLVLSAVPVSYGIAKYNRFEITPGVAANEMLASFGGTIMVCDLMGNVLYQGKSQRVPEGEKMKIVNRTVSEGTVKGYRIVAGKTSFCVSASLFKKGGGVVMIFHDETEIEERTEKEKEFQEKLEKELGRAQKIREALTGLASSFRVAAVERFIASMKALELGEADDINAFSKMAERAKE